MNHRTLTIITFLFLNLLVAHRATGSTTEPITLQFPRRQPTPIDTVTTAPPIATTRAPLSTPKSNTDFICHVIDSITATEMLSRQSLAATSAGVTAGNARKASPAKRTTVAPDITVLEVKTKRKISLSQFKGQVVLLDFWASWCGPCQRPMAVNQEILRKHPESKNKAVILTVSIDEELETVRDHLQENRWNETLNTWAPPDSPAPDTYGVKSIPTMVLIDAEGMVVKHGDIGNIEAAMSALIE